MALNSVVWFLVGIVSMMLVYSFKGVPPMWVAIITALGTAIPAIGAAIVSVIHASKSKDCASQAEQHMNNAKAAANQ